MVAFLRTAQRVEPFTRARLSAPRPPQLHSPASSHSTVIAQPGARLRVESSASHGGGLIVAGRVRNPPLWEEGTERERTEARERIKEGEEGGKTLDAPENTPNP